MPADPPIPDWLADAVPSLDPEYQEPMEVRVLRHRVEALEAELRQVHGELEAMEEKFNRVVGSQIPRHARSRR